MWYGIGFKKYWNNYIIGYSCKTNSLPWILNFMRKNNCFAEVVSSYEYRLAKKIGYDDKHIVFNGSNKSKDMFLEALNKGAILNIDSQREIKWLKDENFEKEINNIKNIKIVGLHIHNTAKTRSLKIYNTISNMACEIAKYFDYDLDYIDIGVGFFGGVPGKPTYDEYIKEISSCLLKSFSPKNTKLILETGSALIVSPISFLSEVVDVKDTFAKRIVTINTSRNIIDPFFAKSQYFFRDNCKSSNTVDEQVICGYTCLDNDRLMTLINNKEFKVGD
ncbi:TPA: hypothetical protein ACY4RU_001653 [Clostridium perfringens]